MLPWARFALHGLQRQFRKRRDPPGGMVPQWYLLHGRAGREAFLGPKPAALTKLLPPTDRFWADPFLWSSNGEEFIFFEEWIAGEPHAHISTGRVDQGRLVDIRRVIEEPYHLSYPSLFEFEGALYMVPESTAAGTVGVYRCDGFPDSWRRVADLLPNTEMADPTVFEHGGLWWLFGAKRDPVLRGFNALHAFYAKSPLAEDWEPHMKNPIVRDHQTARPAGRVMNVGGVWIRPAQDGSVRYGYALVLRQIIELSPDQYQEKTLTVLRPTWEPGLRANHHIDWHAGSIVMDAQRLVSR